jgi:plasmid stabilization system protein ParE
MYHLIIKPHAIEMAQKAYQWYEKQRVGLGDLFLSEVENCYDRIESSPLLYAKINKNFRQIILRTFPYVIVFEILNDDVVIYAVFHTSRNPRRKFKK